MSSPNARKRPAPDTIAALQQMQQQQQQIISSAQNQSHQSTSVPTNVAATAPQGFPSANDHLARWPNAMGDNTLMMDAAGNAVNLGSMSTQAQFVSPAVAPANSTALTRRPTGRALMPTTARQGFESNPAQWSAMMAANPAGAIGTLSAIAPAAPNAEILEQNHISKLELIARDAKKEALAAKKQIPPFVQKLSSFLDDETGKYRDLIRWSAKGDSFFVMNEDEFAKKLIPDLFKHNNYASFVRQLNMYGFHKRVGLSDNSMRASERKSKNPSEYYNDYFRRGHPDLLWLISKPKNNKSKSRQLQKNDSDGDSGDEVPAAEDISTKGVLGQGQKALPSTDYSLSRKEFVALKDELRKVRDNQTVIQQSLQQYQDQNRELFRVHKKHEQHIRAILNFLAMHFRKSLEDHSSNANIGDLMATFMPQSQMHQQGNVFDIGEFVASGQPSQSPMGPPKRVRHLLEAPPARSAQQGMPQSTSASASASATGSASASGYLRPEMGSVTEILDGHSPDSSNIPLDFQSLADSVAAAAMYPPSPSVSMAGTSVSPATIPATTPATSISAPEMSGSRLAPSPPQRAAVSTAPTPPLPATAASVSPVTAPGSLASTPPSKHAVPHEPVPICTMPPSVPPVAGSSVSGTAPPVSAPALSPILRSIQSPSVLIEPDPNEFLRVQKMVQDQDSSIQELTNRIGPLSPNGRLPFDLGDPSAMNYFGNDPSFDINEFLDASAYTGEGDDFNLGAAFDNPTAPTLPHPQTSTPPVTNAIPVSLEAMANTIGMTSGTDLSELSMNSPIAESRLAAAQAQAQAHAQQTQAHGMQIPNGLMESASHDLKRRRMN
ncbi:Heat shock factor protein [Ceratocystis lukuohia]|uniref:Heat shock factor protein n=2 Tax=Ceratocystis TaxID=5157 RepID=A0A0F8BXT5_CERFI|nr:Heat shock factor protein [Ceratocystis platani]